MDEAVEEAVDGRLENANRCFGARWSAGPGASVHAAAACLATNQSLLLGMLIVGLYILHR